MSDFKEQLETIEKTVGEKKIEKVKLEERQRKLTEERDDIQKQLEVLGIKPSEIEGWLEKEEAEIKKGIDQCNVILKVN
jgi:chromosome segregation ATPase